jgi:HipA-like protein
VKRGAVYYNGLLTGYLKKRGPDDYIFVYEDSYAADPLKPAISISLPKTHREHQSKVLFPFFYGLLAEGINKEIQCRLLKIDENDDFTRLLKTAGDDTIGAITVKEINE